MPAVAEAPTMETRDLNFKPLVNSNPKVLTSAQIEEFNERGYLLPFNIFNQLEADRNRAYFDYLLAEMKVLNDGRDTYAINGYQVCCEGIYDFVMNPKILDLVSDLIGPNVVCWGTHFFCKMPHDPKSVPMHQDASYWPFSPARTVTVWLAIDDTSTENGCMSFVPGTHRVGHIGWKETKEPAVLNQEIENVERFGKPVPIELKAGDIEMHADMLVHGSPPNPSGKRRCGLTLRYCPPEVKALNVNWTMQAVLCRGVDNTGNWRHIARPSGNDLRPSGKKPKSIGAN
jgi:hypothetical protein